MFVARMTVIIYASCYEQNEGPQRRHSIPLQPSITLPTSFGGEEIPLSGLFLAARIMASPWGRAACTSNSTTLFFARNRFPRDFHFYSDRLENYAANFALVSWFVGDRYTNANWLLVLS